ncbi:MAG: hypothetical protein HZA50_14580 [Planctomycetes bacterium]|nr:hypothetical protein [Planctomycetota bacterium]
MRTSPFRIYLRNFTVFLACFALAIAGFNLLVDPLGVYRVLRIAGLEACKYKTESRIAKAEILRHGRFDAVIFGSSRAEFALDPRSGAWGGMRVANCAIRGASAIEIADMVDYAVRIGRPSQLLICVDFYMFNERFGYADDYAMSRFNPAVSLPEYHLNNLLSLGVTTYSCKTLDRWRKGKISEYDELGFYDRVPGMVKGGFRAGFRRSITYFTGSMYPQYKLGRGHFEAFERILRTCREKGIRLDVAILPIHAMHLECIAANGLWQQFGLWKLELTRIMGDQARRDPGWQGRLWDFTGYAGYTVEPVPPDGDKSTWMNWYWDSSHFRKELGELVLRRILKTADRPGEDDPFGVLLDPSNVSAHFYRINRDGQRWIMSHPEEVEFVRGVVRQAVFSELPADEAGEPGQNP